MWHGWYRLDENRNPVPCDVAELPSNKDRIVKQEYVGEFWVSTVFLGLDHSFGEGPPLLWETMVFAGDFHEQYMDRYSSEKDALEGHEKAKTWAKEHSRWYRRMFGQWWHRAGAWWQRKVMLRWEMWRFRRWYGKT